MSSSAAIAKILNNQTKDKGTNELKRKLNIESNMVRVIVINHCNFITRLFIN